MRVHIVCRQPDPTRILQRLANLLASGTGWTVGHDYDPAADLNYAFPYLDMRGNMPERVAALFTHREDIIPAKVALWRRCAEQAVLRITWASQYEADLAPHGPTRRILPPLDREHFSPGRERKPPGMQLRAGVSGYTYSGGRKGERLLAQTLQHGASQMFEWSGVGRGWPVPTRLVPYAELPAWYRSLDLYVCPSLIEGIPYGPLEALACGVPVVSTDYSAVTEVVGPGGILVKPNAYVTNQYAHEWALVDEPAMSDAVLRLIGKPALRRELGRLGRKHAASYTWTAAVDQFDALLTSQPAAAAA